MDFDYSLTAYLNLLNNLVSIGDIQALYTFWQGSYQNTGTDLLIRTLLNKSVPKLAKAKNLVKKINTTTTFDQLYVIHREELIKGKIREIGKPWKALKYFIEEGNFPGQEFLLTWSTEDYDIKDAVSMAACTGKEEAVDFYLVNYPVAENFATEIFYSALSCARIDFAKLVLEAFPDITKKAPHSFEIAKQITKSGNPNCIDYVLSLQISGLEEAKLMHEVMYYSLYHNHLSLITHMLGKGVSLKIKYFVDTARNLDYETFIYCYNLLDEEKLLAAFRKVRYQIALYKDKHVTRFLTRKLRSLLTRIKRKRLFGACLYAAIEEGDMENFNYYLAKLHGRFYLHHKKYRPEITSCPNLELLKIVMQTDTLIDFKEVASSAFPGEVFFFIIDTFPHLVVKLLPTVVMEKDRKLFFSLWPKVKKTSKGAMFSCLNAAARNGEDEIAAFLLENVAYEKSDLLTIQDWRSSDGWWPLESLEEAIEKKLL